MSALGETIANLTACVVYRSNCLCSKRSRRDSSIARRSRRWGMATVLLRGRFPGWGRSRQPWLYRQVRVAVHSRGWPILIPSGEWSIPTPLPGMVLFYPQHCRYYNTCETPNAENSLFRFPGWGSSRKPWLVTSALCVLPISRAENPGVVYIHPLPGLGALYPRCCPNDA